MEKVCSISSELNSEPELLKMIQESRKSYQAGEGMSTSEFIRSISPKDFIKMKNGKPLSI